jgi:hypothetical protein
MAQRHQGSNQERHERRAAVDASYAAYDTQPLDEADEWGDLASFHDAVVRD